MFGRRLYEFARKHWGLWATSRLRRYLCASWARPAQW